MLESIRKRLEGITPGKWTTKRYMGWFRVTSDTGEVLAEPLNGKDADLMANAAKDIYVLLGLLEAKVFYAPSDKPVLTVADADTWESLILVHPTGEQEVIPCEDFNPEIIMDLALEKGWVINQRALEVITGRWFLKRL